MAMTTRNISPGMTAGLLAALLPVAACSAGAGDVGFGSRTGNSGDSSFHRISLPHPGAKWDWQFSGTIAPPVDIAAFGTDPDSITAARMAGLRKAGVYTICYVSVGTVESYRDDAERFPAAVVGKTYDDWPDEKFLDIRRIDVLLPIMRDRFRRCRDLGFDAIEPDNMDVHANDSGFAISGADTVAYVSALADVAHALGLGIAQKNAPELVPQLIGRLDFAITESCFQNGWCAQIRAYGRAGKPVFDAEYSDRPIDFQAACGQARKYRISMILKDRDLHAGGQACTH